MNCMEAFKKDKAKLSAQLLDRMNLQYLVAKSKADAIKENYYIVSRTPTPVESNTLVSHPHTTELVEFMK